MNCRALAGLSSRVIVKVVCALLLLYLLAGPIGYLVAGIALANIIGRDVGRILRANDALHLQIED